MANLSKAFSVLSRACDRLARMGVTDVHQRITARILPPEKCGAEDRALELAQEAIGELHARGLEAEARALSLQLEVEPPAPARLAGSTVIEPFLDPPPLARAMGRAVLRLADSLFPAPPAVPDQAHVTPASPLTPEDLEVLPPVPEVPVPPVSHEVKFGEGLGAGVEVGLDLASGPDLHAVVPAPAAGYAPGELEDLQREIDAEEAGKDRAHHEALDGAECDAERAAAQAELPAGQVLPDDLPPVAAEDLQRGDLVALVDGKLVKAAPPSPSTPADRDQAEHIEDVVGGAPEAPSAPSAP